VWVTQRGRALVRTYAFYGGARMCQLDFNCASALRHKLDLARHFKYGY
jgi:hypothetical protein